MGDYWKNSFFSNILFLLKSFHEGIETMALAGGNFSKPFDVTVLNKQSCVFAPVLIKIYIVAMTLLSRSNFGPEDRIQVQHS